MKPGNASSKRKKIHKKTLPLKKQFLTKALNFIYQLDFIFTIHEWEEVHEKTLLLPYSKVKKLKLFLKYGTDKSFDLKL